MRTHAHSDEGFGARDDILLVTPVAGWCTRASGRVKGGAILHSLHSTALQYGKPRWYSNSGWLANSRGDRHADALSQAAMPPHRRIKLGQISIDYRYRDSIDYAYTTQLLAQTA